MFTCTPYDHLPMSENREHANAIGYLIIKIFILKSQGYLKGSLIMSSLF